MVVGGIRINTHRIIHTQYVFSTFYTRCITPVDCNWMCQWVL